MHKLQKFSHISEERLNNFVIHKRVVHLTKSLSLEYIINDFVNNFAHCKQLCIVGYMMCLEQHYIFCLLYS